MKYKDFLEEPQVLSNRCIVANGDLSKKDAFDEMVKMDLVDPDLFTEEDLEITLMRFGFAPENVENREDFDGPVWYTGATPGVGSKKNLDV